MTVSQDHVAECSILLNFYHENNTEFLKGSSIAGCTCSKKSENVQNLFFEHKSVKKNTILFLFSCIVSIFMELLAHFYAQNC